MPGVYRIWAVLIGLQAQEDWLMLNVDKTDGVRS